ncbi:MAG TPA: TIR domain-containing protein [Anaerolineales bacterium]|nr:TIR domain-containing protein [Anaerolineales bacterium]
MGRIEKTVFISYRRAHGGVWARAIYQDLVANGYDAFFDFQSIDSGDFSKIIIENIKARAHFVVLLAPSALERCEDPSDWLRREIETAIEYKRNIVPILLEGFDFGSPEAGKALTGKFATLKKYNALRVYADYFEEGMARLRNRYLNIALDSVLHPISEEVQRATREQQFMANNAQPVMQKELTANEWFEKGLSASSFDEQLRHYSEAIRLKPDYAEAYLSRGFTWEAKGNVDEALADYRKAISLRANYGLAFISLYSLLQRLGNNIEAVKYEQIAREFLQKENEYNQACFEAMHGNAEKTLELLKIGLEKKQATKEWAQRDPDFEKLRDDPRFKEIVGE